MLCSVLRSVTQPNFHYSATIMIYNLHNDSKSIAEIGEQRDEKHLRCNRRTPIMILEASQWKSVTISLGHNDVYTVLN